MELFIKVYFWIALISFLCRLIVMATVDYPRSDIRELGSDVANAILALAFVFWAGILVY